jgi:hypothetical protein
MHRKAHAAKKKACRCTPITTRAGLFSDLEGGFSRILAMYLRVHLLGTHGCLTVGVPLQLGASGGLKVLWAKLSNLVADGEGFELAYEWRGASSLRPCLRHYNVLAKGSDLAARDTSGQFVELACSDPTRFREWDHADLCANAAGVLEARARLQAGGMAKGSFKKFLQAAGFNATSKGLLADETLARHCDWVRCQTYDWMHSFLQNGILNDECWAMVKRSQHLGCTPEALRAFLQEDWLYPAFVKESKHAHEVFNPKRKPENKLRASASELLGMYGMMRHFIETEIPEDPSVDKERKSFMACCAAVDLILEAKRSDKAAMYAPQLQQTMQRFMQAHCEAYGEQLVKPKHHWGMDISSQLARDNMVLDTFALERLHLRSKRIAHNVGNTAVFEASTLSGMIAQQLHSLRSGSLDDGLQGATRLLSDLPDTLVAVGAKWKGKRVRHNDIVFHGSSLGMVVTCARRAEEPPYVIVELYVHEARVSQHSSRWRSDSVLASFAIDGLALPRAWKHEGRSVLVIV